MDKPHCGNCDYFSESGNLTVFGVCDIDLTETTPTWGWCPSWAERRNNANHRQEQETEENRRSNN